MQIALSKPHYGYDAPEIVKRFGLYAVLSLLITIIFAICFPKGWISILVVSFMLFVTFALLMPAVTIILGSLYFKFRERDWLFSHLSFEGNENVLDVGCGRGLLLIAAAKKLTIGKVFGLDLWVQADQANNSKEKTLENTVIEGVQNKVDINNGDMRKMPFHDLSMDMVISSWAIHNIYDEIGRREALTEILRVLKPGGQIAILDIDHAPSYRDFFIKKGLEEVQLLGPRYTFGNKTYLVLAKKSA